MTESAASPAGRASGAATAIARCPGMVMIAADTTVVFLAPPLTGRRTVPRAGGSLE